MKNSNSEIIKRVNDAKKMQKNLTHIADKTSLSTEDKMKLGFCKHFVQFANNKKLKLTQIAEMMNIPLQRISEITNYKIDKFTVDQLIKNLSILAKHDAQVRAYMVFLEQAAELPVLKVAETRRLTKDLKEASRISF